MDMLTGYGSDASSEGDRTKSPPRPATVPAVDTAVQSSAAEPLSVHALLPTPSSSGAALFASMPAPKQSMRQSVTFRLPRPKAVVNSDEEDERPKKKLRPSSKGKRLADFLPPPSNDASLALGSGKRLDVDDDDDFRDDRPPVAVELGPGPIMDAEYDPAAGENGAAPGPERLACGNEAYRVAPGAYGAASQDPQYGAQAPPAAPQWAAGSAAAYPAAGYSTDTGGAPPDPSAAAGAMDGERMLAEALAAEASKAAKHSKDPFADLGVKFVEVNQEKLRYVNPAAREAMNATRTAFGADYEARLRAEAGAAPDKVSKRKHQISSLYHAAKMKELEMMDMRGQGLKTKAQTQAKYGW